MAQPAAFGSGVEASSGASKARSRPSPPDRLAFAEREEQDQLDIECDTLVTRCQQGDKSAQRALIDKVQDPIYRYAKALLDDAHEAKDVTQEAIMAGFLKLPTFEIGKGPPFTALLMRVARNQVYSRRRKQPQVDVVAPEQIEDLIDEREEAPSALDQLTGADNWISNKYLAIFTKRLPPDQRRLVELCYFGGLSIEEAAKEMDRSKDAAKQLHARALATLRKMMVRVGCESSKDCAEALARVRYLPVMAHRRFALQGSFRPASEILGRRSYDQRR